MNSDETIKVVNSIGNIELEDAVENINIVLDGTDSLGTDEFGDNIITNTFIDIFPHKTV